MAGNDEPQTAQATRPRPIRRGIIPPQFYELVTPSVRVGVYAGVGGVLFGVGTAIYKDLNPWMLGFAQGGGFFLSGTTLWLARSTMMKSLGREEDVRPFHKTLVTAAASSTGGAMMGLLRGPTNVLPSIFVWGIAGAGCQALANRIAARPPKVRDENETNAWVKWRPLKKLSDEEYVELLEEKKLKVDVDLALIEDRIVELRALHAEEASKEKSGDSK